MIGKYSVPELLDSHHRSLHRRHRLHPVHYRIVYHAFHLLLFQLFEVQPPESSPKLVSGPPLEPAAFDRHILSCLAERLLQAQRVAVQERPRAADVLWHGQHQLDVRGRTAAAQQGDSAHLQAGRSLQALLQHRMG
ncbi:hypothetical protein CDAR_369181 [Caerostris darwini]|uniref:Uncharacterized protein n=1 Tax=Caerostris darwini TaxID=1538125 RepID=A0AAV4NWQ3_9ARAC|nr:hypothetical protein CDAR_369181 [Caerostris darwini]